MLAGISAGHFLATSRRSSTARSSSQGSGHAWFEHEYHQISFHLFAADRPSASLCSKNFEVEDNAGIFKGRRTQDRQPLLLSPIPSLFRPALTGANHVQLRLPLR